jgi:hypothetical protein
LREVKRRKRMSSGGMGARGRRSRYWSSKTATREDDAVDFAARFFLGAGGRAGAAVGVEGWSKRVGGGVGEKSCRN